MLVTVMLQVGDCQRAAPSTPATAAAVLLVALLLLTQMSTLGAVHLPWAAATMLLTAALLCCNATQPDPPEMPAAVSPAV